MLARRGIDAADGIDVELDAARIVDEHDIPLPPGTRIETPTIVGAG
jgi:hypothetical protein